MSYTFPAIVVLEGRAAGIRDIPKPQPRDDWVIVKVKAVAVNPTDFKHIDFGGANPGSRSGCDYAGIVESVGKNVTKYKPGDRIAGLVHGGDTSNHENGAFGEYLIAKPGLSIHIPENMSFEQAATLGVSLVTVAQGFYKELKLPFPSAAVDDEPFVLIYAASTATGIFGVQFAKASGFHVIATASLHNFEYLESIGADVVFDYKSPKCAMDIKRYTKNKLTIAWDCIGTGTRICAAAMSDKLPGKYGTVNPSDKAVLNQTNPKVDGPLLTIGYEAFGEPWIWNGYNMDAKQEELAFASTFFEEAEKLLANGTIKPIYPEVNKFSSGLEGVVRGLDELRENRVSGSKLVYTL